MKYHERLRAMDRAKRGALLAALAVLAGCQLGRDRPGPQRGAAPVRIGTSPRTPPRQQAGSLEGVVRSAQKGPGPVVVYAQPIEETAGVRTTGTRVVRRSRHGLQPKFLVVAAGQGVRFENDDELCHQFFSASRKNAFDTGLLRPGHGRVLRFAETGEVSIYCSLHATELATILVVPTHHFAVVGPDGSFEIADLEPGAYEVVVWRRHRARRHARLALRVGEHRVLRVDAAQLSAPIR